MQGGCRGERGGRQDRQLGTQVGPDRLAGMPGNRGVHEDRQPGTHVAPDQLAGMPGRTGRAPGPPGLWRNHSLTRRTGDMRIRFCHARIAADIVERLDRPPGDIRIRFCHVRISADILERPDRPPGDMPIRFCHVRIAADIVERPDRRPVDMRIRLCHDAGATGYRVDTCLPAESPRGSVRLDPRSAGVPDRRA